MVMCHVINKCIDDITYMTIIVLTATEEISPYDCAYWCVVEVGWEKTFELQSEVIQPSQLPCYLNVVFTSKGTTILFKITQQ